MFKEEVFYFPQISSPYNVCMTSLLGPVNAPEVNKPALNGLLGYFTECSAIKTHRKPKITFWASLYYEPLVPRSDSRSTTHFRAQQEPLQKLILNMTS